MSLLPNLGSIGSGVSNFYNGAATQSVRFPVGEPHLQRTPGTSGNQKKWTSSFWVKRTKLGSMYLWSGAGYSGNDGISAIYFDSDQLHVYYDGSSATYGAIGPALYRDVNAWYHIVWAVDAANTVHRIWVNGVLRSTDTNKYPENFAWGMNRANTINKFGEASWGDSTDFEGYLADFYHLDGQYLDYTSFAEFKNGVLIPKVTSGLTFGTNGFHLEFKENSVGSGDTDTIGADTSGEDNHLDSAIIAADDCNMPDSPENNFCVLNVAANTNGAALTEGCLLWTGNSGASRRVIGTHAVTSGKWYWEFKNTTGNRMSIGIANLNLNDHHQGNDGGAFANEWVIQTDAKKLHDDNSGSPDGYGVAIGNGDLGMIAVNMDTNDIWFGREGAWFNTDGSSNSATVLGQIEAGTNTNAVFTNVAGAISPVVVRKTGNNSAILNFGQDSSFAGTETAQNEADSEGFGVFYYAPPDGYLALCTVNLPEPLIGANSNTQANDHMQAVLYEGDGSVQNIAVNFKPDLTWIKNRDAADPHQLFDSSRGATFPFDIAGSLKGDSSVANDDTLTDFIATGFTLGDDDKVNTNNESYVSWNWKANGGTSTGSGNESGDNPKFDHQSNTLAGFSIVEYEGTGANGTFAHGVKVNDVATAPDVIWFKHIQGEDTWAMWHHQGVTNASQYIPFGTANASPQGDDNLWNGGVPSATIINIGVNSLVNRNLGSPSGQGKFICYCFAEVEGYSKFSTYFGNNSTDGTFVHTGFRPSFVLTKINNGGTGNWTLFDTKRDPSNTTGKYILNNSNDGEGDTGTNTAGHVFDILSNGFKLRNTNADRNGDGVKYLYMAFAEDSFKYANAR